ncbi:zinc finger protein 846-like [Chaetodon trifascialis]|uniref:zinc finger protein 846-like n=1 Tax=Chaetodon trifascialis TaxID=109706 RepID=UPI00399213A9
MSDCLTKEFRDQLTRTMESVLTRAVFEIMKIFENSLHNHQLELAQKGEEIAQLQIKLQKTEIKLMDSECGGDGGAEMRETQMPELLREPEDTLNVSGQTSDVPEIDFVVPADWCTPLGYEAVTKQDEAVCPSVRLRSLYIPLLHLPVEQEVGSGDVESHQQTKGIRKSRRGSSLKERDKHTQDGGSPMLDRGTRRPPVRNEMKKLLQNIKHEDLTAACLRKGWRKSTGKEKENTLKSTGTESKSTEQETVGKRSEKRYSCKFCKKVFDTQFGRSVHVRSHKKCRGCKKEFPYPSFLERHKPYCEKLKKLLVKEAESTKPPKSQSCVEEKPAALSKKHVIVQEESTPSASTHSESSLQKNGPNKKHSCVHCNKKFGSHCKMKEHMRVHTGEKPFPCIMCPKKFRINQSLKLHIMRMHTDQGNSSETNGRLTRTVPSEDLISPSEDTSQAVNHNKVQR